MPAHAVRLLRAALAWLLAGCALGALMLAAKGWAALGPAFLLRPVHREVLLVGWLVQFVAGTAFWILPRLPGRPRAADAPAAALVLGLLNLGVLTVAAGVTGGGPRLVVAGRAAELLAVVVLLGSLWPRARAYGLGAGAAG